MALGLAGALVASCGQLADQPGSQARTAGSLPRETPLTQEPAKAAPALPKRPNVLVIETDDMRADDLRFMPNVRRLFGERGLTFANSFAPDPLCAPSRASFLSGQYAHNHRVYTHQEPYGFAAFRDRQSIATALHGAGYQTGLVGKYLNGYGEQYLRSDKSSLRYIPPGWDQWYAGSDHLWDFNSPNYAGGTYSYDKLVQNINGTIHSFPKQYSTDVVAEQARGVIDGFEKKSAPWFVWWTPTAPHHGLPVESDDPAPTRRADGQFSEWDTPGRPDWVKGMFDDQVTHGAGTPAAGSAEKNPRDKPYYLRKLPQLTGAERAAETTVTRQRGESLYALDVQIRQTFRHLRRLHQLRNTVIVFTSDNGYYLGEHLKRSGKVNLHEPSLRVPLLVVGPGVPHGRRYDPVTTVDLAPTFAAYAGTSMPGADGTSLLPLIRDGDRGWDRAIVTEGTMGFGRYGEEYALGRSPLDTRGLRLGRWKLTRYSTGETELYDLASDPLELDNLARKSAYAATLRRLGSLYDRYHDCRGDQCRVALPSTWRLTPAESRRTTRHQQRATQRYYGS
jgi:arylsulfatase A-like enzyme